MRAGKFTGGSLALTLAVAGAWAYRYAPVANATPMPDAEAAATSDIQISAWNQALAADPVSAIALGQLAGLHLQRGRETGDESQFHRAEDYARRSIALRTSRNGASFATLGAALLARHEFAAADSIVTELTQLEPDIPEYRAMLGEIKLERGDYGAARIAFDSLYNFRSHLSIAPRLARWMELNGKPRAARKLLYDALAEARRRPDLPREQAAWFHFRAGDIDMRHGRLRKARASLTDGLLIEPRDYRLLLAMSQLEAVSGNPGRAIEFGDRAMAIRFDAAASGLLGEAHAARGDRAAAEQFLKAMEVAFAGASGTGHRPASLLLLDHGRRLPEVLAHARAEIMTRPDIHGYDVLGWALHKSGRNHEARAAMTKALSLGTQDATIHYHAGMIELALADTSRARFFLERAIRINPRFHPTRPKAVLMLLDSLSG